MALPYPRQKIEDYFATAVEEASPHAAASADAKAEASKAEASKG
jgi:hypothetical protein